MPEAPKTRFRNLRVDELDGIPQIRQMFGMSACSRILMAVAALALSASSRVEANPTSVQVFAATDFDYAPYAFLDSNGQPSGYIVDLLRAVARNAGLKVEIVGKPKAKIFDELRAGQIDLAPLMMKGPENPGWLVLGDTHTVGYDAIFIHRSEKSIRSGDDLHDRRVIVVAGSLAEQHLSESRFGGEVTIANSMVEAMKLLNSGHADAFIGPQSPGLAAIQSLELGQVKLAPEPHFGPYTYRFAFGTHKGNAALIERLDNALRATHASGELRAISEKWLKSLEPEMSRRLERQRHLMIAVFIACGLAIVMGVFVLVFKLEVNRKTRSLAANEKRFRNVVENLPGVVFRCVLDGGWKVEYISDSIERLSGYPASEFISGSRTLMGLIHPEDFWQVNQFKNTIVDTTRIETDFRIITRSGEIRWLHARARTATDEDDRARYLDGIFIDITDQKRVADLLTQQQSRMASSARLSALGEMAGGIAHEINNPLAIINLRTHQLAQLAVKGKFSPNDVLDIAGAIESTSIRISKIVKSLQTVARESEQDPFEFVSLKAILNDTLELCFQRMKKHGIELIIEGIDGIEIECRRVQISQVLINLFNNAFDAVVGLEKRYIVVSARELGMGQEDHIEISVIDSGSGIARELAQKIFQPFFTTKGPGKGTGLGLSISKGMIEAHDGFIWLDTDHPTTRFVIVLPRRQSKARGQIKSNESILAGSLPDKSAYL